MNLKRHAVRVSPRLVREARQELELNSDTETVTFALEEILRVKRQQRAVVGIFDLAVQRERELAAEAEASTT